MLHESGKVGLQVAQFCQARITVAGADDPLGEQPAGAEGLDRSGPLDSEAVPEQLDQLEHRALRIIELTAQDRQILPALEGIGVTVAKNPTAAPVDRTHLGAGLVQLVHPAAVLGQDVLHSKCVWMIRPADPDPVVSLVEQLQQRIATVTTIADPDSQFQPSLERTDVVVSKNPPLSLQHVGQQLSRMTVSAGSTCPDCVGVSDVQYQRVIMR